MSTAQAEALEMKHTQLYINGEWVDGENSDRLEVISPATEETIAAVSYGTAGDTRRALEAAQAALGGWQSTNVYQRAAMLKQLADRMRENVDYLATALTMEQ